MTGLEPACLATYEPKSYVSASSTTSAFADDCTTKGFACQRTKNGKFQFIAPLKLEKCKTQSAKCKTKVSAKPTYLNHLRSKYLRFAFCVPAFCVFSVSVTNRNLNDNRPLSIVNYPFIPRPGIIPDSLLPHPAAVFAGARRLFRSGR